MNFKPLSQTLANRTAVMVASIIAAVLSNASASTVVLTFTNSVGVPDTNVVRVFTLDSNRPVLADGTIVTSGGIPARWTPNASGVVSNYLATGNYFFTNNVLGVGFAYRVPDNSTAQTGYKLSALNTFETVIQIVNTNAVPAGVLTNLAVAQVFPDGSFYYNGAWYHPTNSQTCGIQELLNMFPTYTNNTAGVGGGRIQFAAGFYFCTNTIIVSNRWVATWVFEGAGINSTWLVAAGSNDLMRVTSHVSQHASLAFRMSDMALGQAVNTTNVLLYLNNFNLYLDRCNFGALGAFTNAENNYNGMKLGYQLGILKTSTNWGGIGIISRGTEGVYDIALQRQSVCAYVRDCVFTGLAHAAAVMCDHTEFRHNAFVNIGSKGNPWITSPACLLFDSPNPSSPGDPYYAFGVQLNWTVYMGYGLGDCWSEHNYFNRCTSPYLFHTPLGVLQIDGDRIENPTNSTVNTMSNEENGVPSKVVIRNSSGSFAVGVDYSDYYPNYTSSLTPDITIISGYDDLTGINASIASLQSGNIPTINATTINATTITASNIPTINATTITASNLTSTGTISGNGAGLNGVKAAVSTNLVSGVTATNFNITGTATWNGIPLVTNAAPSTVTNLTTEQISKIASAVTNNATGVTLTGTFIGDGSALTNQFTYITLTTNILGQTNTTATTYTNNSFNFTLGAGRWLLQGFLKVTTASTTSGIQCQIIATAGSAIYSGGYARGNINQSQTWSESQSTSVFAALIDASQTTVYGQTATGIIIDVPSSVTFAPQIYQRSAIDVANRPALMTNSWLLIRKIQ